jgi:hypothetical protein
MSTENTTTTTETTNIDPQVAEVTAPETNVVEQVEAAPVAPQTQTTTQVEHTQVDETLNQRQQFLEKISAYWLEHGDLKPVVEALNTDYRSMSAEDIIKADLREKYPGLSNDRFEKLYRKQVVEKYSLDADLYDEDDVALGRELLERDAEPVRKRLQDKLSEWIPPTIDPKVYEEQQKQIVDNWNKTVTEDPSNKNLIESKTVAFKVGESEFKASVDPTQVLDISSDVSGDKFFKLFAKKDEAGNVLGVDFEKWNRVVAFALYEDGIVKGMYDLGSSSSSKDIVEKDIKNITIDGSGVNSTTQNAEDAKTALLKSFLTK